MAEQAWRPANVAPEAGRKIVAIYEDGSGAELFWAHDDGLISDDGDEYGRERLTDGPFSIWAYLPDGHDLWCERRAEDPMTLRLPGSPHP